MVNVTIHTMAGGRPELPGTLGLAVDRATNRLTGKLHDVAGNLLESTAAGAGRKLAYLDQGHVREVKDGADALLYRYYYDADGKRRIKAKAVSGNTSITANCSYYFYEGEDLIGEQDRGLQVQPAPSYDPKFLLLDHLGTTRGELAFPGGTPTVGPVYDTMPYGELINGPAQPNELVLFTGKPRDLESGMDFFGARYYFNQGCRWISADQPFADIDIQNPQSWNLFTYVRNNPINNTDPNGMGLGLEGVLPAPQMITFAGTAAFVGATAEVAVPAIVVAAVVVATIAIVENPDQVAASCPPGCAAGAYATNGVNMASAGKGGQAEKGSGSPNPDRPGTRGKPDHQQTAAEEAEKMGGQQEVRVDTPGGQKGYR